MPKNSLTVADDVHLVAEGDVEAARRVDEDAVGCRGVRRHPHPAGSSRRSRRSGSRRPRRPRSRPSCRRPARRRPGPGPSRSSRSARRSSPRRRGPRTTVERVRARRACSAASPATSVPVLPGMPAWSKSLRTQSAVESVSVPSGMRDAPPGRERQAVVRDAERRCRRRRGRRAPPSLTAIGVDDGDAVEQSSSTPSSFASRSLPSGAGEAGDEQQRDRAVLERVRGQPGRATRPSASRRAERDDLVDHAEGRRRRRPRSRGRGSRSGRCRARRAARRTRRRCRRC